MAPLCFTSFLPLRISCLTSRLSTLNRSAPHPAVSSSPHLPPRAVAAPPPPSPSPPPLPAATPTPTSTKPLFQCSVCKTPYPAVPPLKLSTLPPSCSGCGTKALQRRGYVDLTPTTSTPSPLLRDLLTARPSQSIFQLPTVSYAYERGWRAGFQRAGFPGIDAELALFLDFCAPADVVLDLSCGSGLMARRLATCGEFGRVIAADYSEAMLRQAVRYAQRDVNVPEFDVIRADVRALPIVDGGVDAVHCGAALHCWPNVQDGLAEMWRVVGAGGAVFATTFLRGAYLGKRGREVLGRVDERMRGGVQRVQELAERRGGAYRFFEREELEFLFKAAGFVEIDVEAREGCAIVRCRKPEE